MGGKPMTAEEFYWQIHEEIKALHQRKGHDYGTDGDPFANLRAAEAFGMPAWKGVLLRMEDKMRRLRTYCIKGELANESVEDAFLDLGNYAMLGLSLFREAKEREVASSPRPVVEIMPLEPCTCGAGNNQMHADTCAYRLSIRAAEDVKAGRKPASMCG